MTATATAPEATAQSAAPTTIGVDLPQRLEGQALLDYARANAGVEEKELIKGAGYFRVSEDGKVHLLASRYYKAVSIANGFAPAPKARKESKPRVLTELLRVGPKGLIPVGPAYTRKLELKPGSYVSVYVDDGVLVIDPTTEQAIAKTKAAEDEAKVNAATATTKPEPARAESAKVAAITEEANKAATAAAAAPSPSAALDKAKAAAKAKAA